MAPKKKAEKMSLGDFLGDKSLGSWADEMEDMPVSSGTGTGYGGERRSVTQPGFASSGGYASTNDRGYAMREQLPLPTKPPYTAHLGNLSFDATEGDIHDFFAECEVTSVRIVEDKMERKPKGFGYVEFATLDGLKKALELNNTQFQGRQIRISVADPPKDRPDAREFNDWSRKGPLPELPGSSQRRASERGFSRGYEAAPEMERGGSRRGQGAPSFEGDGKPRDFGNWERKGPLSPAPSASGPGPMREGGRVRAREGMEDRKNSPSWGEGRSQDGSRPPRGEFRERAERPQQDRQDRQPTAPELDNQWRTKMRPDAPAKESATPTPEPSAPSSPAQPAAPTGRPRLNLAKRTISEAQPSPTAASTSDAKASPFGAARPIDTAGKEKEIDEKRQLAIRQKKEADDKARDERRAKEAAAKAEKASTPATENGKQDEAADDEDVHAGAQGGKSYEILRRANEEGADNAEDESEAVDGDANGTIIDDKAVKPQEVVRDPPKGPKAQQQGGGAWRKKSATAASGAPAGSMTENLQDDGWSTVASKSKKPTRGGPPSRAIAS